MSTYDAVAGLPLRLERITVESRERQTSSGFLRRTTLVQAHGGGETGVGEDVTYAAEEHPAPVPKLALGDVRTLDDFSRAIGGADLFDHEPDQAAYRRYRRWGFESAALDLALRQAGRSLAGALGREPRPVVFVVSMRLPQPESAEPVRRVLARYPRTRLKLDVTAGWTDALIADLVATGAVDSVDFKGAYSGTVVDTVPDADLYRRVAEAFPHAWLEDPALTPETEAALAPHMDRVTWDAPIHDVADVTGLAHAPKAINLKPSRFGSVRALFDAYDLCADRGIRAYGGGQFELGAGRGHIQYLAALFHADTPNDVAPGGYNEETPPDGLPASPLTPAVEPVGFRWADGRAPGA